MEWADYEHMQLYWEFMAKAKAKESQFEWAAALFLLSSPLLAKRCAKYIKPRSICFTELMEAAKPWSSSEKALVKLAAALFNSSWKADINDIFWSLDLDNTDLALEAIKFRFR